MTVSLTRAVCPSCGGFEVNTIHIRSELHKDLVCRGCVDRGVTTAIHLNPRQSVPPVTLSLAAVAAGIDDGPVPPPTMPGRRLLRKVY